MANLSLGKIGGLPCRGCQKAAHVPIELEYLVLPASRTYSSAAIDTAAAIPAATAAKGSGGTTGGRAASAVVSGGGTCHVSHIRLHLIILQNVKAGSQRRRFLFVEAQP